MPDGGDEGVAFDFLIAGIRMKVANFEEVEKQLLQLESIVKRITSKTRSIVVTTGTKGDFTGGAAAGDALAARATDAIEAATKKQQALLASSMKNASAISPDEQLAADLDAATRERIALEQAAHDKLMALKRAEFAELSKLQAQFLKQQVAEHDQSVKLERKEMIERTKLQGQFLKQQIAEHDSGIKLQREALAESLKYGQEKVAAELKFNEREIQAERAAAAAKEHIERSLGRRLAALQQERAVTQAPRGVVSSSTRDIETIAIRRMQERNAAIAKAARSAQFERSLEDPLKKFQPSTAIPDFAKDNKLLLRRASVDTSKFVFQMNADWQEAISRMKAANASLAASTRADVTRIRNIMGSLAAIDLKRSLGASLGGELFSKIGRQALAAAADVQRFNRAINFSPSKKPTTAVAKDIAARVKAIETETRKAEDAAKRQQRLDEAAEKRQAKFAEKRRRLNAARKENAPAGLSRLSLPPLLDGSRALNSLRGLAEEGQRVRAGIATLVASARRAPTTFYRLAAAAKALGRQNIILGTASRIGAAGLKALGEAALSIGTFGLSGIVSLLSRLTSAIISIPFRVASAGFGALKSAIKGLLAPTLGVINALRFLSNSILPFLAFGGISLAIRNATRDFLGFEEQAARTALVFGGEFGFQADKFVGSFDRVKNAIRQVASESIQTVEQVSDAALELAKGGVASTSKELLALLPLAADFATISGQSAQAAARTISVLRQQQNATVEELGPVLDKFIRAVQLGPVGPDGLLSALSTASETAKRTGVDFAETLAFIIQGIRNVPVPSKVGTGFSRAIERIVLATKRGRAVIDKQLGSKGLKLEDFIDLDSSTFKKQIDGTGGLTALIKALRDTGTSLGELLEIFGARGRISSTFLDGPLRIVGDLQEELLGFIKDTNIELTSFFDKDTGRFLSPESFTEFRRQLLASGADAKRVQEIFDDPAFQAEGLRVDDVSSIVKLIEEIEKAPLFGGVDKDGKPLGAVRSGAELLETGTLFGTLKILQSALSDVSNALLEIFNDQVRLGAVVLTSNIRALAGAFSRSGGVKDAIRATTGVFTGLIKSVAKAAGPLARFILLLNSGLILGGLKSVQIIIDRFSSKFQSVVTDIGSKLGFPRAALASWEGFSDLLVKSAANIDAIAKRFVISIPLNTLLFLEDLVRISQGENAHFNFLTPELSSQIRRIGELISLNIAKAFNLLAGVATPFLVAFGKSMQLVLEFAVEQGIKGGIEAAKTALKNLFTEGDLTPEQQTLADRRSVLKAEESGIESLLRKTIPFGPGFSGRVKELEAVRREIETINAQILALDPTENLTERTREVQGSIAGLFGAAAEDAFSNISGFDVNGQRNRINDYLNKRIKELTEKLADVDDAVTSPDGRKELEQKLKEIIRVRDNLGRDAGAQDVAQDTFKSQIFDLAGFQEFISTASPADDAAAVAAAESKKHTEQNSQIISELEKSNTIQEKTHQRIARLESFGEDQRKGVSSPQSWGLTG